jgi:hypothetical protein
MIDQLCYKYSKNYDFHLSERTEATPGGGCYWVVLKDVDLYTEAIVYTPTEKEARRVYKRFARAINKFSDFFDFAGVLEVFAHENGYNYTIGVI